MIIHSDPSINYNERTQNISCIVLHYTNMKKFDEALDVLTGRKVLLGPVSAHYAISRKGKIYQLVAEEKRAWHAGASIFRGETDVNSCSIGIELDNEGDVYFKEYGAWPSYSKDLMKSLTTLLQDILKRYPHINPLDHIIGHNHIAPQRKTDPGPHFPWKDLWKALAVKNI